MLEEKGAEPEGDAVSHSVTVNCVLSLQLLFVSPLRLAFTFVGAVQR